MSYPFLPMLGDYCRRLKTKSKEYRSQRVSDARKKYLLDAAENLNIQFTAVVIACANAMEEQFRHNPNMDMELGTLDPIPSHGAISNC